MFINHAVLKPVRSAADLLLSLTFFLTLQRLEIDGYKAALSRSSTSRGEMEEEEEEEEEEEKEEEEKEEEMDKVPDTPPGKSNEEADLLPLTDGGEADPEEYEPSDDFGSDDASIDLDKPSPSLQYNLED